MGLLTSITKSLAAQAAYAALQALSEPEKVMVALGEAFGPQGIKHFSQLTLAQQTALLARVPVLREAHKDWPGALAKVPRTLTCYVFVNAAGAVEWQVPKIIRSNFGLAGTNFKPIPPRGGYVVGDAYVTMTTMEGLHMRFGFRPDDVDLVVECPSIAFKRV